MSLLVLAHENAAVADKGFLTGMTGKFHWGIAVSQRGRRKTAFHISHLIIPDPLNLELPINAYDTHRKWRI